MNKNKIKKIYKIILALSGGIDSSVSLWILKKLGYKVKCVFIQCWENNKKNCNIKKDYKDSKKICKKFNIKLYYINLSYEYWNKVFKIFIKNQKKSKHINPDILCNKKIKFDIFLNFALNILKGDYISTGHYVKKKYWKKNYIILKSLDKNKDQSYFLYTLKQNQIKKCIFPLGNYYKKNVRIIAKNLNLINSKKKDSTGICFIGKKNFFNFIKKYIKFKPGKIITLKKKIIGIHKGLPFYTIGQRKKLNINIGQHTPYYVAKKNIKKNELIVVKGINNKNLYSIGLYIKKIHFIYKIKNKKKIFCKIKTRYRQKDVKCKIYFKKKIIVIFKKPIFAVTYGQSAVFYKKNLCLGGGIITKNIPYKIKKNKKNPYIY